MTIEHVPEVFLDESGNTGPDLGNLSQPVYALASVLGGSNWDEVLERDSDAELKFSSLASTREGRDQILTIVQGVSPSKVKTAIADKKHMAVAKMVDELIEPLASASGFDLYGTGSHMGQTEMLYVALRELAGEERLNQVVESFVRMMRLRNEESVERFYQLIDEVGTESDELNEQLSILLITEGIARKEIMAAPDDLHELDPSVPLIASLSQSWTAQLEVPHRFVHDVSGVLERWKPILERLSNLQMDPRTLRVGEKRIRLPVLTFELTFADSATSLLIQVADVIAGATRYLAAGALSGKRGELWERLDATPLKECLVEGLWFIPPNA